MTFFRQTIASLLLGAFVLGGLLAPVAHEVTHLADVIENSQAPTPAPGDAGLTTTVDVVPYACELCEALLSFTVPDRGEAQQIAPEPVQDGIYAASVRGDHFSWIDVRGPPLA
jgi:hypothetical protein